MEDVNVEVPYARDVELVLRSDPWYIVFGRALSNPWFLGFILALLVVAMIVAGPSTDSHFIYTDF